MKTFEYRSKVLKTISKSSNIGNITLNVLPNTGTISPVPITSM